MCNQCLIDADGLSQEIVTSGASCVSDAGDACNQKTVEYMLSRSTLDVSTDSPIAHPLACGECRKIGHVYAQPQLRACDACITANRVCLKMAELVKAQDGESSNTTMMKAGNRRIQAGGILTMSLTTILPDLTHALKRVL